MKAIYIFFWEKIHCKEDAFLPFVERLHFCGRGGRISVRSLEEVWGANAVSK